MQGSLKKNTQKAKEKKGCFDDITFYGKSMHKFEGDDVEIFLIK